MTAIDRFERELPAALDDLADARTPDYLDDILGRTARHAAAACLDLPRKVVPHG